MESGKAADLIFIEYGREKQLKETNEEKRKDAHHTKIELSAFFLFFYLTSMSTLSIPKITIYRWAGQIQSSVYMTNAHRKQSP